MRKIIFFTIVISLIITLIVTGCASSDAPVEQPSQARAYPAAQAQEQQTPDVSPPNELDVIDETQVLGEIFPDEPEDKPEYESDKIFQDACEATAFFNSDEDGVIELDDYNFATHVMNIVFGDPEQLLGHSIRYEGILKSFYWPITSRYIHNVIRYTDITGGGDYASIGLEIYYDGEISISEGAWVEVVGILERTDTEDGFLPVRLRVISLVELDERGNEFVPAPAIGGG